MAKKSVLTVDVKIFLKNLYAMTENLFMMYEYKEEISKIKWALKEEDKKKVNFIENYGLSALKELDNELRYFYKNEADLMKVLKDTQRVYKGQILTDIDEFTKTFNKSLKKIGEIGFFKGQSLVKINKNLIKALRAKKGRGDLVKFKELYNIEKSRMSGAAEILLKDSKEIEELVNLIDGLAKEAGPTANKIKGVFDKYSNILTGLGKKIAIFLMLMTLSVLVMGCTTTTQKTGEAQRKPVYTLEQLKKGSGFQIGANTNKFMVWENSSLLKQARNNARNKTRVLFLLEQIWKGKRTLVVKDRQFIVEGTIRNFIPKLYKFNSKFIELFFGGHESNTITDKEFVELQAKFYTNLKAPKKSGEYIRNIKNKRWELVKAPEVKVPEKVEKPRVEKVAREAVKKTEKIVRDIRKEAEKNKEKVKETVKEKLETLGKSEKEIEAVNRAIETNTLDKLPPDVKKPVLEVLKIAREDIINEIGKITKEKEISKADEQKVRNLEQARKILQNVIDKANRTRKTVRVRITPLTRDDFIAEINIAKEQHILIVNFALLYAFILFLFGLGFAYHRKEFIFKPPRR